MEFIAFLRTAKKILVWVGVGMIVLGVAWTFTGPYPVIDFELQRVCVIALVFTGIGVFCLGLFLGAILASADPQKPDP